MYSVYTWILDNKKWIFSGIGVLFISILGFIFRHLITRTKVNVLPSTSTTITNQNIINVGADIQSLNKEESDLDLLKAKTHILFIDDDTKFKVVNILTNSGWIHTKKARDISSIDDEKIIQANILFIDIHGVGRKLEFSDEGLGLALAIKGKYPEKKVVIYSAENQGDRFHHGLRKADDFLPKNADPYEFQQVTERLARQIFTKL